MTTIVNRRWVFSKDRVFPVIFTANLWQFAMAASIFCRIYATLLHGAGALCTHCESPDNAVSHPALVSTNPYLYGHILYMTLGLYAYALVQRYRSDDDEDVHSSEAVSSSGIKTRVAMNFN